MFYKKCVLENLAEFTGKHLSRCLFINEVASPYTNLWFSDIFSGIEACNFIEKETPTHVFSCEFCDTFKNSFFYTAQLQWLPLKMAL